MKLRIAAVAFLLGIAATALVWITVQPFVARLLEALLATAAPDSGARELATRLRGLLPLYLALDAVLLVVVCYAVLYLAVGRPLERTEHTLDQLGRLDLELPFEQSGGPLLSRLQASLRRAADALRREKAVTQSQLSQLRAANEQLRRTQTELVAAERLATVGRLAAGIAHEVGNPLSGILGYLSIARAPQRRPEEVREFLERIEAEVHRIDGIVRGLLDLGRPSRGAPVPVELSRLVRSTAELVSQSPELERVEVRQEVPPELVVKAEPGPLSQVAINLLLNAAQAIHGQGTITLRARCEGEEVWLEVEDSGPGIPADLLPRIFEPFFTTKQSGTGSGLGLPICQHLVTSMGGRIWAENQPGGGARFTVALAAA